MKFKVGDRVVFVKIYDLFTDEGFEFYKEYVISYTYMSKYGPRYRLEETGSSCAEEDQIIKCILDNPINRLLYPEYIEIEGRLYPRRYGEI